MRLIMTLSFVLLSAPTLAAQDTTSRSVGDSASASSVAPYRDPHRARILGAIIPGAGQFYAGEYFRGYMAFVATGSSLVMGPLIFSMDGCTLVFLRECDPNPKWPYKAVGSFLVGAAFWKWFSTARDAPHAAERANARHRAKTSTLTPLIEPSPTIPGQWNTGVTVRW
jgi:TM2 domain-containing membrane protein YozV